jgi:hypothetical protein
LNQSSNFKRWKGPPSENNLKLGRISVDYPYMLSKTCLNYLCNYQTMSNKGRLVKMKNSE